MGVFIYIPPGSAVIWLVMNTPTLYSAGREGIRGGGGGGRGSQVKYSKCTHLETASQPRTQME